MPRFAILLFTLMNYDSTNISLYDFLSTILHYKGIWKTQLLKICCHRIFNTSDIWKLCIVFINHNGNHWRNLFAIVTNYLSTPIRQRILVKIIWKLLKLQVDPHSSCTHRCRQGIKNRYLKVNVVHKFPNNLH